MTAAIKCTTEIGSLVYEGNDERELFEALAHHYGYTLSDDPDQGWSVDLMLEDGAYRRRFFAAVEKEQDAPLVVYDGVEPAPL